MSKVKISPLLQEELDKANDWELVRGSAHVKVKINGKLVGIVPPKTNDSSRRAILNVISQVRRERRECERN